MKTNNELAAIIAREILELGSEPNDKCHRIAFKGGAYPDNETELGGLCEGPLAATILEVLNREITCESFEVTMGSTAVIAACAYASPRYPRRAAR